jgi:hypothetical protein
MIGSHLRSDEIDWFVDTFELVIKYNNTIQWIIQSLFRQIFLNRRRKQKKRTKQQTKFENRRLPIKNPCPMATSIFVDLQAVCEP